MSIPLVQEATKDAINTSIIAIKRNIERINMLLGLVDSGSPDLSGLATKQELEDAIDEVEASLQPVDSITSGDMHAVTSNAVANSNAMPVDTVTSGDMHSITSNAVYKGFTEKNSYGYIPLLAINRLSINVSSNNLSASLLNQYLGGRIGGGITIVDITGTYANSATMICNCVSEYGTNNVYGYGIVMSYYMGFQKFKLKNGTWVAD